MATEPVTLLVPNYNGARFLRETLTRLLAQTYRQFQLIVADNCSTDDSVAIVRSFDDPRLRLVLADKHVPVVANFNRAIALVETPYFATCASDEVYEPGWLGVMVDLMERRQDAFFACCKADSADENGRVYLAAAERYKGSFWPAEEPCIFERARYLPQLLKASFLICTTGLYRTSAVRTIGPIDDRHNFAGDWQYWVRGLVAGFTIIGTHRPLVHYRRHSAMTTKVYNANLYRFEDELEVIAWIAQTGYEQGLLPSPTPNYSLVRNTLLSEYALRLAAGDRTGTDTLLGFAREKLPGFRGSAFDILARTAGVCGRPGGWVLRAAEWAYLRMLCLGRR